MDKLVVGIGFYRREQWPQLLESAVDADILEKTYDDWLDVVDLSVDKITAQGIEPRLVEVDIEDLLSFCSRENLPNNARTRSKFVARLLKKTEDS